MKTSINLLTVRPGKEKTKERKKMVAVSSIILIIIFLIFNLVLFGTYFFLRGKAEQTLLSLKEQESLVLASQPLVESYSNFAQKLVFLSQIWAEQPKMGENLIYIRELVDKDGQIERVFIDKIGQVELSLSLAGSSELETFLAKLKEEAKKNSLAGIKIISTQRNEDTNDAYRLVVTFKFPKS